MEPALVFEQWKALLRLDCIQQRKLEAYEALGDAVLKLLYDSGLDPTVNALSTEIEVKNSLC